MRLSVVVPAYNEADRIGRALADILDESKRIEGGCEILVVSDGSTDATERAAAEILGARGRVLSYLPNRGKGAAVRHGVLHAEGDVVLFADADGSTPFREAHNLLAGMDGGADVAIGTRKAPTARLLHRQPWAREAMGKGFTALSNAVLGTRVSDFTCGFKAFRSAAARRLFAAGRIDDWAFDAEILFLASRLGLRVVEIPVAWHDVPGTKVRLSRDVVRSLWGLARIRSAAARGLYGEEAPPARRP